MIWWSRFEAYAGCFGFLDALEEGSEKSTPRTSKDVLDEDTTKGKLVIAGKKRNQTAMSNLRMAFTSEGSMSLIYKAKVNNWPMGLAHKDISKICQEYNPEDTMARVELR
jgi:hypothetical protein